MLAALRGGWACPGRAVRRANSEGPKGSICTDETLGSKGAQAGVPLLSHSQTTSPLRTLTPLTLAYAEVKLTRLICAAISRTFQECSFETTVELPTRCA